ncbi:MAG: DMT family transporter [Muribaculaceae bacterium]|nr:DMT family transporter [Muribaculaceae bacterium]
MTKGTIYNIMALTTIIVWGVTFISTKVLIADRLSPVEIFIIRFAIAYLCTLVFSHDKLWADGIKDECMMLAAGITGGSLYFIAENSALSITFASNVSLIICCAPVFTMILGKLVFKDSIKPLAWFGTVLAFVGVAVVVLNGSKQFGINPIGDLLTVLAALSWAAYCIILKRLNRKYGNLFITRKVFAYGVITALIYYVSFPVENQILISHVRSIIANLLFLSVGASFLCYLMWNTAVKHLGAERTSNYIYLVPLITIIASTVILDEPFTFIMAIGTAMIIGGVMLSTKN